MVVPFNRCLARPSVNGINFLLTEHLDRVANYWGNKSGSYEEQLYFLGGLCHDAAKSRREWQEKIMAPKRPIHAIPSAIIYSYYASKLLNIWEKKDGLGRDERTFLRTVIMRVIRDICDHHSVLGNIDRESPWNNTSSAKIVFSDIDLGGLHEFLCGHFEQFASNPAPSSKELIDWKMSFAKTWSEWQVRDCNKVVKSLMKLRNIDENEAERLLCLRNRTASFIAGDRYHAVQIVEYRIDNNMAAQAISILKKHCNNVANDLIMHNKKTKDIIRKREMAQLEALKIYKNNCDNEMYTLSLPTGSGKTLTSLRIGLEACLMGKCSRIIYAAPYISILSQASKEISDATKLDVLQHHHLSMLSEDTFDDRDVVIMESWQSPVVTTTFNQLFRALFPKRAQELIRMPAMKESFIIIDEPQIIDSEVWNLFLAQMESGVKELNCQILFISATLPPFKYGLRKSPYEIKTSIEIPSRYNMLWDKNIQTEIDIAQNLVNESSRTICTVMNTIKDSCEVFIGVKTILSTNQVRAQTIEMLFNFLGEDKKVYGVLLFNLNGLMTPIHKELVINMIRNQLNNLDEETRIIVISTQIIEAGVNLSFTKAFRALGIFPSHIQLAGRVNRHGELDTGDIQIVRFLRNGEIDSRQWVYTSKIEREESDNLMNHCNKWSEKNCLQELNLYYEQTFKRNHQRALLNAFSDVAKGEWALFSGIEPFKQAYNTTLVFVPWPNKRELQYINKFYETKNFNNNTITRVLMMMNKYNLADVDDIYEMYTDRERLNSLSFVERKQFMALIQQFTVAVGNKLLGLASRTLEYPILRLAQQELYSKETGLGHHVGYEDREMYF